MSGSIIIFGGNKESRKSRAVELVSKTLKKIVVWGDLYKNPDIKVLDIPDDKKSIGIGEIREVIKYLAVKPFSGKSKFVVINDANTLTREAQNAMLKTLEEPSSSANLILLTKTLNDLLGTVVSRCKMLEVKREKHEETAETDDSYRKILQMDLGKRLDWAGETAKEDREDILQLLEKWLAEARDIMVQSPSTIKLTNLKQIVATKGNIENTNVNARLALEALVVNL